MKEQDTILDSIADGVTVPTDVEVVAHCNVSWPVPSVLPMRRLGFDVRKLLETCIDTIRCIRLGKRTPKVRRLVAEFEKDAWNDLGETAASR